MSVEVLEKSVWKVTSIECVKGQHDYEGGFELGGVEQEIAGCNCDRPNFLKCRRCSQRIPIACNATFTEVCRSCSYAYRGRTAKIMEAGLSKGRGWLEATFTAPGESSLPWDKSKCKHEKGVACAGSLGCVTDVRAAALFNTEMPKLFNRMVQDIRREFPKRDIQYGKVAETQKRGLIHYHVLFTGLEGLSLKRVARQVKRLARKHGFGKQTSVKFSDSRKDIQRAVNYCVKYLTKVSQRAVTMGKAKDVYNSMEVRLGGYRRFTQSSKFGPTMKEIKAGFRLAYTTGEALVQDDGEVVGSAERSDTSLDLLYVSYTRDKLFGEFFGYDS